MTLGETDARIEALGKAAANADEKTAAFIQALADDAVSFETETPSPPRRHGLLKRWLQARQIRRLKQEHEDAIADESHMDELLDKIARSGKHALTDEERRFLERVSHHYRNRL